MATNWPGDARPSPAAIIASVVAILFVAMHWLRLEPIEAVAEPPALGPVGARHDGARLRRQPPTGMPVGVIQPIQ